MSRSKGHDGRMVKLIARLENAIAGLARYECLVPITRIRIAQAADRSGLHNLLNPAMRELDDMTKSISAAKCEVAQVLSQLTAGK